MPFLFPSLSFPSFLLIPSPLPFLTLLLLYLSFSLFPLGSFALTQNPGHAGYMPRHWAPSRPFICSKLENHSLVVLKKENKGTQGSYRSWAWDMILGQKDTSSWSQASCEREQFPRTLWMSFLSVTAAGVSRGLNCEKILLCTSYPHILISVDSFNDFFRMTVQWEKEMKRKEDTATPKLWRRFVIDM